ncbi:MAG: c-type cytochrome domain-containing protein [Verrucomicrobiaceae bacterium]
MRVFLLMVVTAFQASALDYKRDVMPIFKKKCYDCHSDEAKKVKGGLRLDDEEAFYKRFAKNDVVIPGDWDASYLFVSVVLPQKDDGAMPPEGKGDPLTEEEIKIVAQWIYEGARIAGEKGKKGSQEMDPEKILKFKNGQLMVESEDHVPEVKEPEWEEWLNGKGQKITAKCHGLSAGKVDFELKGGKRVAYPLDDLSAESQARVKVLAGE